MLTTKYDSPSTQITEANDFSFVLISKVNKPQDSATILTQEVKSPSIPTVPVQKKYNA
jgi:hypothetical protein